MISRMVDQKGFDLLGQISEALPALGLVCPVGPASRRTRRSGGVGESTTKWIGVRIGFDDALAHLMEGGADLFLMPSQFEPCGLNQMYSLRYGTVPVVHATGGSLIPSTTWTTNQEEGQGYVHRLLAGRTAQRAWTRPADVRESTGVATDSRGRHARGFLVGRIGARVRQGI